jgi:hypothetical protein
MEFEPIDTAPTSTKIAAKVENDLGNKMERIETKIEIGFYFFPC